MSKAILPLAADLRRQVRTRAKVRKVSGYWTWRHDCGHTLVAQTCIPSQSMALSFALEHVRSCRS